MKDTIHGQPTPIANGTDSRREIREIDLHNGSFQHFHVINEGVPLGNHFHREKFEVFHFIQGSGTLRIAPVDDAGAIYGEVETISILPGTVVEIQPGTAHRFDLEPGTIFTCFSSRHFDPRDMISCPIEI